MWLCCWCHMCICWMFMFARYRFKHSVCGFTIHHLQIPQLSQKPPIIILNVISCYQVALKYVICPLLYQFKLFSMGCDPWPLGRNFEFGMQLEHPWPGQIKVKFQPKINQKFLKKASFHKISLVTIGKLGCDLWHRPISASSLWPVTAE